SLPALLAACATGASFTGFTVNVNRLAMLEVPSVAVTRIGTAPLASSGGVRLNVMVTGLKLSQLGNGEPSASDAVTVNVAESGSENVPAGIVKVQCWSSLMA